MRGFQHLLVGRQRQALVDEISCLFFMTGKGTLQVINIAVLEIKGGLLYLVLVVYITVGKSLRPGEIEHVLNTLDIHCEPLSP